MKPSLLNLLVALAFAATACRDPWSDCPPGQAIGESGEVRTAAGNYNGYRVTTDCLAVVHDGALAPQLEYLSSALSTQLRTSLDSVWDVSAASGCGRQSGIAVYIESWRDVDAAIAITGAILKANAMAVEVRIVVEPSPSSC
jgi:hypothetical protein